MIDMSLPGERREVEFMADGSLDIERYASVDGVQSDASLIERFFDDLERD
jgi:hypothetical protein